MNKLPLHKRVSILSALAEGNSLRSTTRMNGVSINTVTKLLVDAGQVSSDFQSQAMRNLTCRRLQIDEIWAFCYTKKKNVPEHLQGCFGIGDVWTFAAIDADTKLVPSWMHGNRDGVDAKSFIEDVAGRLAHRVQITTDGHKMYLDAMAAGFAGEVDYAMLVKHYGNEGSNRNPDTRYSPGECCGTEKITISGTPDHEHVSTSYIERQNLTMRMRMRRFTRLTNAFSKKLENLAHAVSLHFLHYNFIRPHMTLKTTPAVAIGISDHVWSIAELVNLIDQHEEENRTRLSN